MSAPSVIIRPVTAAERAAWEPLWTGYLDFYQTKLPRETYDATFLANALDPASRAPGESRCSCSAPT